MLIAHISDLHLAGWGRKAYGIAPTAENLAACVEHINELGTRPDVVLVTGDLANGGLLAEIERAASLLDQLNYPYYVTPGNHDRRDHLWSVFGGRACPARSDGFLNYVVDGYEMRLIGLDSTASGEPGGEICATRAKWLDERLFESEGQPTILFMHHPPLNCGVPETDVDGFRGADILGEVVARHQNILRILCGHIHLQAHAGWRGTVVTTAPSMGMELVLDLGSRDPSRFVLDAPAYQLHYWSPEKNLVSHTIRLGKTEGPYPFEQIGETGDAAGTTNHRSQRNAG